MSPADATTGPGAPEELRSLPRRLSEMTDAQYAAYVSFLAGLGLPELRRRQDIVRSQQVYAHEQSLRGEVTDEETLADLDVLDGLLLRAVWSISFPDPYPPR